MGFLVVILIIVGVILVVGVGIYNRLITLWKPCDNAWARVDV
ncbi:MAG: LemA family protein, partial [Candidatus Aminicenantes bacterium]